MNEETHPPSGRQTGPDDSLAGATVEPNSAGLGETGPRSVEDLIIHTGEARGLADTSRRSLELDAPTVGAAASEQEDETDQALRSGIPRSDNAPD